jgi:exopolysaccharide biosynthesis protein
MFALFILLVSSLTVSGSSWYCIEIQSTSLENNAAIWKTENCTNDASAQPLLTVNSVSFDLSSLAVRAIPAVSVDPNNPLQGLPDMAKQNDKFLAGINGGYFWRVDISGLWIDDVCRGKTRMEASKPAASTHPNYGVSDGLVKIDGIVVGNNCNCSGYSRPAILAIDGEQSTIDVVHRAETVDDSVKNAIAAGPNLVSFNSSTGESYVDIPSDDDNINILEHAANTAVGVIYSEQNKKVGSALRSSSGKMIFVTTDGSDECGPKDISCGLNSRDLASLMKDHFGAHVAMSMDQGGSTTMWVKGANPARDGVVSRSHNNKPVEEDGPRNVANGLFLALV